MASYMDDWLILARSKDSCLQALRVVQSQATDMGFRINLAKSDLIPSRQFVYLGLSFNTLSATVQPTQVRLQALQASLHRLSSKKTCTVRMMASLLGTMESLAETVPLGRVLKRPLQRALAERFKPHIDGWAHVIRLGPWFVHAIQLWLEVLPNPRPVPLVLPAPQVRVHVDASNQGWGAHTPELSASGAWSDEEQGLHINHLELLAVVRALEAFQRDIPRGHVKIISDNSSVVAHIRNQGGTHSQSLSIRAENLLLWAQSKDWTLSACHLAGSRNVLADMLSRPNNVIPTEWTLSLRCLQRVWDTWHQPMIDLFATKLNNRLPLYVSPLPDSRALETDALSLDWSGMDAYAFPPTGLLQKVLFKARQEGPSLILIAPMWPWARWFNLIRSLAHTHPLALRLEQGDLFQPHSGWEHGALENFNLHAWWLCAGHCGGRDCRRIQLS